MYNVYVNNNLVATFKESKDAHEKAKDLRTHGENCVWVELF